MDWLDRIVCPIRRVWNGLAVRVGVRRTGLRRLGKEVRTCEYEDVHIMWEMLNGVAVNKCRRRHVWGQAFEWTHCGRRMNLCASF